MSLDIAAFRAVATGTHNVGDVRLSANGQSVEKFNNAVHFTKRNVTVVSVKENLAVRNAFFKALTADGRMTTELRDVFERHLLGDSAAKSLTRNEVAVFLKALDSGSAIGLAERLVHIRTRDTQPRGLIEIKSDTTAAYLKSVNEQKDEMRGNTQTARLEMAKLRAQVQFGVATRESLDSGVGRSIASLVAVIRDLGGDVSNDEALRRELKDAFDAVQGDQINIGAFDRGTQAMFEAALAKVPNEPTGQEGLLKAEVRMVLLSNDKAYFSPSLRKAMEIDVADNALSANCSHYVRPFNLDLHVQLNGELGQGVAASLNNPSVQGTDPVSNAKVLEAFKKDAQRAFGFSVNGTRKDFSTPEACEASCQEIDNWFAEDQVHGPAARNMILQIANQQSLANVMLGLKGENSPFPNNYGLADNVDHVAVSRNPDGTYDVVLLETAHIGVIAGTFDGLDHLIPLKNPEQSSFELKVKIHVSFDDNGKAVCTVRDNSSIDVQTPPRAGNYVLDVVELEDTALDEMELYARGSGHGAQELLAMSADDFARCVMEEVVDPQPFDYQGRSDLVRLAQDYARVVSLKIENLPVGRTKDAALLRSLVDVLRRRVTELQKMTELSPLSYKNVLSSVRGWNTAADVLYRTICDKLQVRVDPVMIGELFLDMPAFDGVKDLNAECKDAKDYLDGLSEKVAQRLLNVLKAKGMIDGMKAAYHVKKINLSYVKECLVGQWSENLNHGAWNVIDKNLTFSASVDGAKTVFNAQSTIVPSKRIPGFSTNHAYPDGVNGYMCHSFKAEHAVNLAQSTFRVNGKKVFAGIRHGVNAAIDILNETERDRANVTRAKETVTAAVLSNDSVMAQINALPPGSKGPVTITIMSTSLLTPDIFRSGHNGEHEMLVQQLRAWRAINLRYGENGPEALKIQVPMPDGTLREVEVKPNFIGVNFGVNGWAVNALKGAIGGSWSQVGELNRYGINQFGLAVTEYVNRHLVPIIQNPALPPADREAAERKRQTIIKLNFQIREMMNDGSARFDDGDAYKMVSRINVLAYLIGATPAWNCKSGKDRTGQLDVESKFLATMIELKGPAGIPEPGDELTDEERSIFQKIALEGGNHEMQVHNTGLAGFKTGGVASIKTRLGGDEYKAAHKGAADFVKV